MSFFAYFKEEFQVIQERDPAIHSPMEVLLYPSFRVMLKYRRCLLYTSDAAAKLEV